MTAARKGDAVLIEKTRRDYVIGQPTVSRIEFEFGVVASATRDGMVKTFRSVGWGDTVVSESAQPLRADRVYVLPAAEMDVMSLMAAAKAHHWPGHPGQPMPFGSIEEARECARPHRLVSQ